MHAKFDDVFKSITVDEADEIVKESLSANERE